MSTNFEFLRGDDFEPEYLSREEPIQNRRRRSYQKCVNVLVFQEPDLNTLLITPRNGTKDGSLRIGPAAAGYVNPRESYEAAAMRALKDDLFHDQAELPGDINLVKIGKFNYPRDHKTGLFYTVNRGPFPYNHGDIGIIYWQNIDETLRNMKFDPKAYSVHFKNAISRFTEYRSQMNQS
jgi:hypothetical protein